MFLQGEDSVVECVHDGTSGNSVNAYMSWNAGKNNRRLKVRKSQIYVKLFRTHINVLPHYCHGYCQKGFCVIIIQWNPVN
jgi:hypothetical protein